MSAWNVSDLLCAAARKLDNFCVHDHTSLKKLSVYVVGTNVLLSASSTGTPIPNL
jgi:hypothetical protein